MGRLQRLTPALASETIAFLDRRPYENVYVTWLIASQQIERGAGTGLIWRDDSGAIAGFCFCGTQIVPCASDDASACGREAIAAFADYAKGAVPPRMIVGSRRDVDILWPLVRPSLGPPRIVRASQPLYALTRSTLQGGRHDATVARATRAELDEIVPHSANMIAGETGTDPRRSNPDFRGRTARIIDAGWWWRYRVLGELAFMCNVGSASTFTAQLQGVWSPPDMRGRGHSTRALAAICDHLLDDYPSLCLFVNDFNAPAIALYERVGFQRVGEFATIIFA
jgi:ribosomal protein S18 acetylase RimI-like enzyme